MIFQDARETYLHGHLISAQQQAEGGYQHFSTANPEWAWKFRLLAADILIKRGLSQDVLSVLNSPLPENLAHGDLAIKKQLLEGLALARLGRLPEADTSLNRAEQLCKESQTSLPVEVVSGRGIVEIARNRPDLAEQFFRSALRLAQGQGNKFEEATARLNIGVVAIRQQHFGEAVDWSSSAREAAQSIDAGLTEEKALGNLGWAYYKMGDFDRSRTFFLDAHTRAHDLGIPIDEARWSYNLGGIAYDTDQFSNAEQYFRESFTLADRLSNIEQITNALTSLAFVMVQQGRLDLARQYSQQAFDAAHKHEDRATELYSVLTKGQIAALAKDFGQAEQLFTEVAHDSKSDASLRWQAQNELAQLYDRENRTGDANTQYLGALNTLECTRGSIPEEEFRLPFLANATHVYEQYVQFQVNRGQSADALRIADNSKAQTLAEGLGLLQKGKTCGSQSGESVNAQTAARRAGGTVLFYWLGEQQSYVWIVSPTQIALVKLPPASEIEPVVQRYRKALLDPPDVLQTANADGVKLYQLLVEPAKRFLAPGSRVIIVPDQALNNLNFETFLVSAPKLHYWIEDVTISYASSLRMLAARRLATNSTSGKLLLIGDPVIPDPKYPQLTEAAGEMEKIEANFPPQAIRVYGREAATPAAYLGSKPEQYSYIHFVAHGTASQLSPLDSAIVLSKATAEEDSFKLHAREIIGHPLRADLVTISACYGSGSTVYNGEGLVGLSWGFIRAGAHNVVGALWAVSDKSTSQLMAQVYAELRKGRRPEDALRDAKLRLLHSDGVFRKPVYWAPFQLYTGS